MTDANLDGHNDLLIKIQLNRFTKKILFCYDFQNDTILWERNDLPEVLNLEIHDIDNDGKDELFCSTYSKCDEIPLGYKQCNTKLRYYSYFFILDNTGMIKKVNGKDILLKSSVGYYEFKFMLLKDQSKVLLGFKTEYDKKNKNLFTFNYKTGDIDTLNIFYHNIINFSVDKKENIVLYDFRDHILNKITLNSNLSKKIITRSKKFKGNVTDVIENSISIYKKNTM